MSKHTQGPWLYGCIGVDKYWIAPDWDQNPVCRVERSHPAAEANARLICAAPCLLEALKDMVSDRNELSQATVDNALKAIAKAEDEGS